MDEVAEPLDGAGAEKGGRMGPVHSYGFGMGDYEGNGVRQTDGFGQELFLSSYP